MFILKVKIKGKNSVSYSNNWTHTLDKGGIALLRPNLRHVRCSTRPTRRLGVGTVPDTKQGFVAVFLKNVKGSLLSEATNLPEELEGDMF